jgi:hypothetical protein
MTTVEELNKHLDDLPEPDREAIAADLIKELKALLWDRQIEADARAGTLDHLINEAKEEHRAGRTRPAP